MRNALIGSMLLAAASIVPAAAQTYPSQPVTIVVPYTPGGSSDIAARIIQDKIAALIGQPVLIDNRPGGTGNVGGAYVAKANPDGYTLLMQSTIIGMFPLMFSSLPYDPLKDFAMVGSISESPTIFAVRAESPYKTLADLVADAKSKPDGLNVGSGGTGSPAHLAAEQLGKLNGFKVTHIPYKGTAPAITDLLAGTIDFASVSVGAIQPQLQSGQARPLVVAAKARSAIVPDVPTTTEAGFAEQTAGVRYFLGAPAGTPPEVIAVLAKALDTVLQDPDVVAKLATAGFDVVRASPEETQAMLQEQYDIWGPIVKELGLKME